MAFESAEKPHPSYCGLLGRVYSLDFWDFFCDIKKPYSGYLENPAISHSGPVVTPLGNYKSYKKPRNLKLTEALCFDPHKCMVEYLEALKIDQSQSGLLKILLVFPKGPN